MFVVRGLGIALVLVGGAALYLGQRLDRRLHMPTSLVRGGAILALKFAGMLGLAVGLLLLYLAYLTTTDDFGR